MSEDPGIGDIIRSVLRWLEEGGDGAAGFQGKVAAKALGIVERELDHREQAERRAVERLERITGTHGSFNELEVRLCGLIRHGAVAACDPMLLAHLRATALDRLAIDQPGYRSLLHQADLSARDGEDCIQSTSGKR